MREQYIKAGPAIRQFEELARSCAGTWTGVAYGKALQLLKDAPKVDPVHAAGGCYCRECQFWQEAESALVGKVMCCTGQGEIRIQKQPGDFCSSGKRSTSVAGRSPSVNQSKAVPPAGKEENWKG